MTNLRKIFSLILMLILMYTLFTPAFAEEKMMKANEINIRDPFVLLYDGKYYMYGTGLSGKGYGCVVSDDLENWSERIQVFAPGDDFEGDADFWAPECHYYNGSFYLFATYHSKITEKRGVAIFKSSSPLGPFEQITLGHITPHYRDCIDGTLYVDEDGQPWMIYVNEWTSNPDEIGTMAAAKLSDDLTHFISIPVELFKANGHLWTDGGITDGPFLYRSESGKLLMLWSNSAKSGGYSVGLAVSSNGKPDGKWIHQTEAVYKKDNLNELDGGHGMLFRDKNGQLLMAIHSPNSSGDGVFEAAKFIPIEDTGNSIRCISEIENSPKIKTAISDFLRECRFVILSFFLKLIK